MARARNVKPGFFESEQLGKCSLGARLLFIALWQLADRAGRLEDRAMKIKAYAFRYDAYSYADVSQWLSDLEAEHLIERYEVEGKAYIEIPTFLKHQNPHLNEKKSVLPGNSSASTVQAPEFSRTTPEKAPELHGAFGDSCREKILLNPESGILNPSSLNPESLFPQAGDSAPVTESEESEPAYWVERLIELHPAPCDPRYPHTFCTDNLHRLGEDPARFRKFMWEVYRGLVSWAAHWAIDGNRFAKPLEKWLAAGGWKKKPPEVLAAPRGKKSGMDLLMEKYEREEAEKKCQLSE